MLMRWQTQCLKQEKLAMTTKFKDGYYYACQLLKLGITQKEIENQANNPFYSDDFDDFNRGMLARLMECDNE